MKRKFNWFDAVVCGIVALAILFGAYWFFLREEPITRQPEPGAAVGENGETEQTYVWVEAKPYDVTVRFNQATTDPFDFYHVGDTVYFRGGESKLGEVLKLELKDLITESLDVHQGKFVQTVNPDQKSVEMTIRVMASLKNNRLVVGEEPIYIGLEFYPQSKSTRSVMTIWDIKEVAAQ